MTNPEYQDGGRSSFAGCFRILQTVSTENHGNKSSIIGFLLVEHRGIFKIQKFELLIDVYNINLEYPYGRIGFKI